MSLSEIGWYMYGEPWSRGKGSLVILNFFLDLGLEKPTSRRFGLNSEAIQSIILDFFLDFGV